MFTHKERETFSMIPRRKPYFAHNAFALSKNNEVELLEKDLEKYLALPNPVVVGQGRIGLRLILQVLKIKQGAEIIMPGYTFGALTKIIKEEGFTPIPIDIDEQTFQMSPDLVKASITSKTSAVLATHLFGEPCDINAFKKIAKKHNLFLIEDCAQSLGAKLNNKLTGTFGEIAFSSFDISKPLQGIRGGVVFSKNRKLMETIRKIRNESKNETQIPILELIRAMFGYFLIQTPVWFMLMFMFSYKKMQKKFVKAYRHGVDKRMPYSLPPLFAHIVRQNLPSFKRRLEKRREIRKIYYSLLKNNLTIQKVEKGSLGSVYMVLGHINADIFKLRRYLSWHGIDIGLGNEIADNCLRESNSNVSRVLKNSISLPIYETMIKEDVERVSKVILNFISKN
ncbi:MAG TPA: aminotransferase class I/II-fold pyridoxal phosphate-dependent enzyme [Patescibacteria group bacterium]|nr:aminotransferase class I/II-fold pyridoxal phosphate-dependent enzyme [Patescibacteria group bacterium]